jgi:hypothetical protein
MARHADRHPEGTSGNDSERRSRLLALSLGHSRSCRVLHTGVTHFSCAGPVP